MPKASSCLLMVGHAERALAAAGLMIMSNLWP